MFVMFNVITNRNLRRIEKPRFHWRAWFPTHLDSAEAWKQEAEIESGKVQVVPGDKVSSRIRRIVGR